MHTLKQKATASILLGASLISIPVVASAQPAPTPAPSAPTITVPTQNGDVTIPAPPELVQAIPQVQAAVNNAIEEQKRYQPIGDDFMKSLEDVQVAVNNVVSNQGATVHNVALSSQATPAAGSSEAAGLIESDNELATSIVKEAMKYLGTDYVWGGSSPSTGFDCSGLIQWAYAQHGINIPRVTYPQQAAAKPVARNDVRAGDLVFYERSENGPEHVALAISPDQVIHAPQTGEQVKISPIDMMPVDSIGRYL